MKTALLCLSLALAACVTSRPVTLPDGRQGFTINCPGTARDIGDCMNEAGRVCAGPYHILDGDESDTGVVAMPVGNNMMFMRGVKRTMIVSCDK